MTTICEVNFCNDQRGLDENMQRKPEWNKNVESIDQVTRWEKEKKTLKRIRGVWWGRSDGESMSGWRQHANVCAGHQCSITTYSMFYGITAANKNNENEKECKLSTDIEQNKKGLSVGQMNQRQSRLTPKQKKSKKLKSECRHQRVESPSSITLFHMRDSSLRTSRTT